LIAKKKRGYTNNDKKSLQITTDKEINWLTNT
jgi:hypothetical protein